VNKQEKVNIYYNNPKMDIENNYEQDKLSSITDENEEENKDKNNLEENNLQTDANPNISEEANLELYLRNDDLTMLEDYVNRHFSNLSQDEMVNKLMSLDENFREKLLNLVMEYQHKISNEEGIDNENNQIEPGNLISSDENNVNKSDIQANLISIDYGKFKNKMIKLYLKVELHNENPQQHIEIINQNNQDTLQTNLDYSNNLLTNNNLGLIANNPNNITNVGINNNQNMIDNNIPNTGIQNQTIPNSEFYPNQNNMYYQQQQNQYYHNMPQNYQNMGYNENNFNQNSGMVNNMVPPMNYPNAAQNNFINNNPNHQMINYHMQMRNQMLNPMTNVPHGGYRKGNYNRNYGGNIFRCFFVLLKFF